MNKNFYFILWIGYIVLDFILSIVVDQMQGNKNLLAIAPCLTAIFICYAAIRKVSNKKEVQNAPSLFLDIILIILMIMLTLHRLDII